MWLVYLELLDTYQRREEGYWLEREASGMVGMALLDALSLDSGSRAKARETNSPAKIARCHAINAIHAIRMASIGCCY